ncbi:SDR family NAD(P)-dependent oxidoreductase [Eilatimonas milleporae]|uniref:NAD(P)-dependent dehydrogenase (Short-subunit alcohol dehydrogenase family) n=1 Tax=Eilatimonas milleporae TaxID=911205 RepID=A0A3M0CI77_9PROT|nr:SDR family oxidoreductase [Eilatimonas milleporae]RMB08457.1 NAD(P)-dependent dehydrogenase (short-subunit alcohol dehydrogenase family) [Eilatimonas milleporae]
MDLGLNGTRALVTGGTRGIGAAIVDLLAREGAHVAFCARDGQQVSHRVAQLQADGLNVLGQTCDVADPAAYLAWCQAAAQTLGGVDIFVANVSGGAGTGEEGWRTAFDVDLMGTVRGCENVLLPMAQSGGGAIVIISSIAGVEAMGDPGPYGTIKAGLLSYASQLARAAGPHGIRVNAVSPGPIHADDGFWGEIERTQPDIYQSTAERHPDRRLGTTEEVARAVAFLASPAASWINGTNLIVDGGFTQRVQF